METKRKIASIGEQNREKDNSIKKVARWEILASYQNGNNIIKYMNGKNVVRYLIVEWNI